VEVPQVEPPVGIPAPTPDIVPDPAGPREIPVTTPDELPPQPRM
jgi:hypothetical protein